MKYIKDENTGAIIPFELSKEPIFTEEFKNSKPRINYKQIKPIEKFETIKSNETKNDIINYYSLTQYVINDYYNNRLDLRKLPIITIDDAEANILDDAIHLRKHNDFIYELGIHFIDLSNLDFNSEEMKIAKSKKIGYGREINSLFNKTFMENNSLKTGKTFNTFSIIILFNSKTNEVSYYYDKSIITIKSQITFGNFDNFINLVDSKELRKKSNVYNYCDINISEVAFECKQLFLFSNLLFKTKKNLEGKQIKITNGNELIAYLSNYVNYLIGKSLYNKYNDKALLISNEPNFYVTNFKSPLRKFKDIIVLHQIICLKNHLNINEMIKYMENITNMKFEEIKNYCLN